MKSKALIHVGASRFQIPSIDWAKQAGFYVVVTDRLAAAPGASHADRFVQLGGDDTPGLIRLAGELVQTRGLAGLWGHADFCLAPIAEVNASFNLPGPSVAAVARALDKNQAKAVWHEAGIATAPSEVVASEPAALAAAAKVGFPVVVKPVGGSGSVGICRADGESQLAAAYRAARALGQDVLVEAFLNGREFGVNGIFHNGRFHAAGISERRASSGTCLLNEVIVPAPLTETQSNALYALLRAAAEALGIGEGCVKGDLLLVGESAYIIELAPRLHGNPTMSHAFPMANGANPIRAYFAMLGGEHNPLRYLRPNAPGGFAGYRPLFSSAGVVVGIEGLPAAQASPGVESIDLFVGPGQRVNGHRDNRGIVGYVFARGDSADSVRSALAQASSRLEVVVN